MPGCFQLPPLSTSSSYCNCGECFLHRCGVKPNFAGSLGFMAKESFVEHLSCSLTFSSQTFCCWYRTLWDWGPFCFLFFCFYSSRSFFLRRIFFYYYYFSLSLQNLKGFFLSTGISTVNIFLPAVIRLPLQPINPGHVLFVDQFWFERMLFASEFKIWFPTTKP